MADDIVQTIKIEVEGADQASAEIKKVGQATEEVQATAASTAGGTQELGKGLDQVSQKSGVSSRELRSLGKIMKEMGAGEIAGTAIGFARIAMVLGPLGVAAFAVAEAFSFVRGKMKEAQDQVKQSITSMAEIARVFAEIHPEREGGWGATAEGAKKIANNLNLVVNQLEVIRKGARPAVQVINELTSADTWKKGLVTVLQQAGVSINDLAADTDKLSDNALKAKIVFAELYKNMNPIQRLHLEDAIKGLKFSAEDIKNIENGPEALKKAQAEANRSKMAIDQLSTSWDKLNKKFVETSLAPPPVEDWSNLARAIDSITDAIDGVIAWFKKIPPAVDLTIAQAQAVIQAWVTTPVANAWGWVIETWQGIGTWFSTKIEEARALLTAWVTTPIANAWAWMKEAWNANVPKFAQIGADAPAGAGAAGGQVGGSAGFAGGGLLGGRGTGTSDSNLAWVSRGEHVMPAQAVSQPGVLALLEALRLSGGNLRAVLDGMGRFAFGGMVRAPLSIPAFAGGGMHNVTIAFPGLPEITGLRASSGVVDELRNAAAMAQVRSGGRKPSRYS